MLFNSYIFILLFLPITLVFYFLFHHFNQSMLAKSTLILSSLIFYGYYNPSYLLILCSSIMLNYFLSQKILHAENMLYKKSFMIIGIAANSLLLFYFKYFNFFVQNINVAFHTNFIVKEIVLPLGISFFTFQQISYVVDSYHGETKNYSFLDYFLFVSFFPQLVAGPILLHDETIPQFQDARNYKPNAEHLAHGFFIFTIGLFKKVIIADTFGIAVNWGFGSYQSLTSLESFLLAIFFAFQLYFDFSGYCDMATGIAKMFNIQLPLNFDAPYRSLSIIEFWKRWHISLGRFLTRYIYIPLGGNRKGNLRTYLNVGIVFLVSGIWHGANWTFILWGILHGLANILNRIFDKSWRKFPKILRWFLTFLFVSLAFLIFKADSIEQALFIIKNAFSLHSFEISAAMKSCFQLSEFTFAAHILHFENYINQIDGFYMYGFLLTAFLTILLLKPCSKSEWKPTIFSSIGCVIMFIWAIFSLSNISTFLYFGF